MEQDRTLSVTELNEYVRRLLAGDALLRNVEVSGELSGYKHHISGHRYFSLKDENARVQCVMFRQNAMGLSFQPRDGMRVRLRASASLFPRDGSYQLYVTSMEKMGVGELFMKYEALRQKLMKEGLFDPAIKQSLPLTPACIGIATSRTGAALRDMVRIAKRRNPNVGVIVAPCSVQGEGAAREIAAAIERLNADGRAEVILCGRGGGSMEDLWAFNEEIVARAIAASRIPVISCVGHETDFTIADFVADVRAATPSMAAEIAVPVAQELRQSLRAAMNRVQAGLVNINRLRRARLELAAMCPALRDPRRALIEGRRTEMERAFERCQSGLEKRTVNARARLERTAARLEALNPAGVLERGYACISNESGVIGSAADLKPGAEIAIRMRDGSAQAQIISRRMKRTRRGK